MLVVLSITEAKKHAGLQGNAWRLFCERTGLVKIPGTQKYNKHAIDLALEYDAENHVKKIQKAIHRPDRETLVGEQLHINGGRMGTRSFIVAEDPDRQERRAG